MRHIGNLPREIDPKPLTDHLLTLGITTKVDGTSEGWSVWAHDEDKLAQAVEEFQNYASNPTDTRYKTARMSAASIRRESEKADRLYRKNHRDMTGYWDQPRLHRRPLTVALAAISVIVYILAWGSSYQDQVFELLLFSPIQVDPSGGIVSTGLAALKQGEIWRLITPIFLHFSIMHIVFNVWATLSLGTLIEYRRGTRVLSILVLITAIASNTGQYLYSVEYEHGLGVFGGLSGVLYGLFGYLWVKGSNEPEQGMILPPSTIQMMLIWLVLCFTGVLGPIANAAHVVGLVSGILLGLARL